MAEKIKQEKSMRFYKIFMNTLIRECEPDEHGSKHMVQVIKDKSGKTIKTTEKWGIPLEEISGNIQSVSYERKEDSNNKSIIYRNVKITLKENEEIYFVTLPLDPYGVDLTKRLLTIVEKDLGDSFFALKVFCIKKDKKEASDKDYYNHFAIPYENGITSIPSYYSKERPEPETNKWVITKKKDPDGKEITDVNKNASLKFYIDAIEKTIAPYFKKLEEARKQALAPIQNQVQEAVIVDEDDSIF